MTSPLAGSLAKTIGGAFKTLFLDAVLTRDGPTSGPAYDPTPGEPLTFKCKAVPDEFTISERANSLIEQNDTKIIMLASGLSISPNPLDRITLRDRTFTIIAAKPDPALATWVCQCR